MANWDQLLPDLLTVIVKKINIYEDFVAFGGVCSSWRSVAVKENFNKWLASSSPSSCSVQPPWLMLAEKETDPDVREFVNMSKGGMVKKMELLEARGRRCMGSMGWLITVYQEGGMDLLHPINRVSISLPHLRTYPLYENIEDPAMYPVHYIHRAALSTSPSATQDYVVMLILGVPLRLAFWKPGNAGWMRLETSRHPIHDVSYHKGKFYAADNMTNLFACDVAGTNPTVEMVGTPPGSIYYYFGQLYLAEYCGDLILVKRITDHEEEDTYSSTEFRICKCVADGDGDDDSTTTGRRRGYYKWEEVNDLGEGSIFIGYNTPIYVPCAVSVGLKPNCIYFTDDYMSAMGEDGEIYGGMDMGNRNQRFLHRNDKNWKQFHRRR